MPFTLGPDDLNSTLATLEKVGPMKGIVPAGLGEASAAHFLAFEQVDSIVRSTGKGECPAESAVKLESFEAL